MTNKKNNLSMLKNSFLDAIANGDLGSIDDQGYIVTLAEFENKFTDIEPNVASRFLNDAVMATNTSSLTADKFLYCIDNGIYRVHSDAIN